MTRIAENQIVNSMLIDIAGTRREIEQFSSQLSSGLKVTEPGDSLYAGTISQLNSITERVDDFKGRIDTVTSYISFSNSAISQVEDLIIRAKEIATQAANESNSAEARFTLAEEVFQIRDHLVSLANSKYMGKYVFSGLNDDIEPYRNIGYTNGSGESLERWQVDTTIDGYDGSKTVRITDNLEMTINVPGVDVFNNAIFAMERLGRSLQGYDTTFTGGVPDGGGNAYTFPADFNAQTQDISDCIDDLETARINDVIPNLVSLAGKMKRLETADSLLDLSNQSTKDVLSKMQDADMIESASQLSLAETALQASMSVTSKLLNLSILNYI